MCNRRFEDGDAELMDQALCGGGMHSAECPSSYYCYYLNIFSKEHYIKSK